MAIRPQMCHLVPSAEALEQSCLVFVLHLQLRHRRLRCTARLLSLARLMRDAISRNQSQSVAISRNQSQSVAINRLRCSTRLLSLARLMRDAISRNQSQSVAISRNQSQLAEAPLAGAHLLSLSQVLVRLSLGLALLLARSLLGLALLLARSLLRCSLELRLMREAIRGHQRPSEAIRGMRGALSGTLSATHLPELLKREWCKLIKGRSRLRVPRRRRGRK
jgi:hypothetical protein